MFNLEVMHKEGNISATRFGCSHENEGWVGFGGVGERDDFWLLGKLSGCDLCNQGLMGVDIFNGSTVDKSCGSWSCEKYTKPHFWSSTRKKDKVEDEKDVGWQTGFDLEDIGFEGIPYVLWPRPVRMPCLERIFQKYQLHDEEATKDQN
jgi:hypothetical protein